MQANFKKKIVLVNFTQSPTGLPKNILRLCKPTFTNMFYCGCDLDYQLVMSYDDDNVDDQLITIVVIDRTLVKRLMQR